MKLVAFAVLATIAAVATPASAAPLTVDHSLKVAQASINVRVGEPRHHRDRVVIHKRGHDAFARRHCKVVVIKERHRGVVVTKKVRRCR